jgi:soluble lytic murein transglycosylase
MIDLTKAIRFLLYVAILIALGAALLRTPQLARLYYPYRYRTIIEENAQKYDVDPLLVAAVIHVESKFDPDAVSRKGALGLMQIMPSTARWIAPQVGIDDISDEMILDLETNILLGTWYLANLSKEFDGRVDLVAAAYNGGRGQVARWLSDGTWSGHYEDRHDIPFPETRQFVQKVRTTYLRYRQLYN